MQINHLDKQSSFRWQQKTKVLIQCDRAYSGHLHEGLSQSEAGTTASGWKWSEGITTVLTTGVTAAEIPNLGGQGITCSTFLSTCLAQVCNNSVLHSSRQIPSRPSHCRLLKENKFKAAAKDIFCQLGYLRAANLSLSPEAAFEAHHSYQLEGAVSGGANPAL